MRACPETAMEEIGCGTVTTHCADRSHTSCAHSEIVALPAETAVTTPFSSTVATVSSLEAQTRSVAASCGSVSAVRTFDSPIYNVSSDLSRETERRGEGVGSGVGSTLGSAVVILVGSALGSAVAVSTGSAVASWAGSSVCSMLGATVGVVVTATVGLAVGATVGTAVGVAVTATVGFAVGATVGTAVGATVGVAVTETVGFAVGVGGGSDACCSTTSTVGWGVSAVPSAYVATGAAVDNMSRKERASARYRLSARVICILLIPGPSGYMYGFYHLLVCASMKNSKTM